MSFILPYLTLPNLMAILYLAMLEGILSVDNALALAALVRNRLPNEKDQKHALRWGILGAYLFRTIVIFGGVWLMQHEWIKLMAAAYLIYMAVKELWPKSKDEDGEEPKGVSFNFLSPLWATIVAVEIMDIMFSIDSIAVTLAVSNQVPVLIAGAVMGIFMMRFAATQMIKLINKFPILEKTAFVLVFMAGIRIIGEWFGVHPPEVLFMSLMFVIIGVSMLLNKPFVKWTEQE